MTNQPSNNFPSDVFYPPNELVDTWANKYEGHMPHWVLRHLAAEAAQWGADQELEACCGLIDDWGLDLDEDDFRAARRPESISLKKLALERCDHLEELDILTKETLGILRSALKELPND